MIGTKRSGFAAVELLLQRARVRAMDIDSQPLPGFDIPVFSKS